MAWFVLLFTVVPLFDLWLLLQIGSALGAWPTFGATLAVAILGGYLGKREGLKVLAAWRRAMSELRLPEDGLVSGLLVVVGAALLVAPGILTDTMGLLLLIPATRRPIARLVRRRIDARLERARSEGRVRVEVSGFGSGPREGDDIGVREVVDVEAEIEAEAEATSPKALPPARPAGE